MAMLWQKAAYLGVALVLAGACATKKRSSSDDDDGSGGSTAWDDDGSGGGVVTTSTASTASGSSTSSATGTSTTTATSSVTTGPMGCDSGTGNDINSAQCDSCIQCSFNADCINEYNGCINSTDCQNFAGCLQGCAPNDTLCQDGCSQQYPAGSQQYLTLFSCAVCLACPIDCDAATNCN